MVYLSDVPYTDIVVGDKVISHLGTPGIIEKLIDVEDDYRKGDNNITIQWENGNRSTTWHRWYNHVEYVQVKV